MESHNSCTPVPFAAGQVIIHENESHAIVEIHTGLGWRIKNFCNATRVNEGKGRGSMDRTVRMFLCYSEKQRQIDYWKMEQSGSPGRVMKISPTPLAQEIKKRR